MSSEGSSELQAPKDDIPHSSTATTSKRKSRPNKKEARRPASSYTLYAMGRRPELIKEQPGLNHKDVERQLGVEWRELSEDLRQVYMQRAMANRANFHKELEAYKKTDSYKKLKKMKKQKKTPKITEAEPEPEYDQFEIPVFSKEFLELNRQRESELRRLRAEVVRLEEEQTALDSNINLLKKATDQLDAEMHQEKALGDGMLSQLDAYRRMLVQTFAHMPFPGTNDVPTLETVDNYMNNIHKLVLEAPGEHQDFMAKTFVDWRLEIDQCRRAKRRSQYSRFVYAHPSQRQFGSD